MVNMHAKSDRIECAQTIFEGKLFDRSLDSWNTMFSRHAKIGDSAMVMRVFFQSRLENQYKRDLVTIISFIQAFATILTSCGAEIAHGF